MSGVYERRGELLASDVDMYRRLRPGTLARMLQEAAIAHTEALGAGREKTLDKGLLWIITRLRCDIVRMPEYGEKYILQSWPGDMMHTLFPRYFRLCDGEGRPLLRGSSLWLLLDRDSRRMALPAERGIFVPGFAGPDALPLPDRTPVFPEPLPEETRRAVRYSETDLNGHLNNTRYLDWAEDLLPADYHGSHRLCSLWAEYRCELPCGETALLRHGLLQDVLWLRGCAGDREAFRLRMEYAPREP